MRNISRRDVIRLGAIGAGSIMLPLGTTAAAADTGAEPHFFLLIVLEGGADPSYMFDARPLSMTRAGKIQNYLGEEPAPWAGRNGTTTLATRLVAPLRPLADRFSVLNGVYMTPGFDGHLQNMNFLFSGSPFGGDSFIPHLNSADTGRTPGALDAVLPTAPVFINVSNHSSVVPLEPDALEQLAERLREVEPPRGDDKLGRYCTCPMGFACTEILPAIKSGSGEIGPHEITGSYCIKVGTEYDSRTFVSSGTCDIAKRNCGREDGT